MDASNFSLLPGELRNLIWEYTLYEPTGVPTTAPQPGLLQTCRTIRFEAELMFYAVNHFRAEIEEDNIQHSVCKWLQRLGETKRKLIRGLHVHCVIASAMSIADANEEHTTTLEDEEKSFMQLMHLLDSIRDAEFGRQVEEVVTFTVGSTAHSEEFKYAFDDAMSFEEMDAMSMEKQECYRAAKFLILCCVYGKEVLVDAMQLQDDGHAAIAALDRRIRENRERHAKAMIAANR